MTTDEFFDWLAHQERRYELVEGAPRLLPYVKRSHSAIVSNIMFALTSALDRSEFLVHSGDFATRTGETSIRYADVMVERRGASNHERTTQDAIILVEVLSDSTMHVDFGPKLTEYQSLKSLNTYVVIAQEARHIWQWSRDQNGEWLSEPLQIVDGNLVVTTLGLSIPVDEIYRGVR